MKIYEIIDEENYLNIGVLLYYEKNKSFIIELQNNLNEWTAPLLFTNYVNDGVYTIPRNSSLMWVKERVIPSGRQNIGSILSNHRLKEYDEMKLLELSDGRCSQDSLYIRKIEELPEFVIERRKHNLVDCTGLSDNELLCFFEDGKVKKTALLAIEYYKDVSKIVKNQSLYGSCMLGCDGYYVTFNDDLDIPAWLLYENGQTIKLKYEDFLIFFKNNIVDTGQACSLLECSRQNLSYLVRQKGIVPLKEDVRGNLYIKSEIINL